MPYIYSHLEDFIQNIYKQLQIYSPYDLNLYSIARLLNISIFPISENSQTLHSKGHYYIFLNNNLSTFEQFETFAHELGHIFLHSGNQQRMNKDYRLYQEWKANLFALHFCVPTFMLQKIPIQHLNKYKISEMFGVTIDFADKRLNLYFRKLREMA